MRTPWNEFESYTEYVDDGHTGTDTERESFQRLLGDVVSGKISCVVVKDLSRFARNYSDAGSLIDNLFVQMGVRFISLAEGVDSYLNPDSVNSIIVPITNVMNGLYATDANGEIRISGIIGTVVVKEVKAASGYVIDQSTQTQTVTVNPMDTQTLTFLNEPLCSLTLTKLDFVTGKPVPGTEFTVKDGNGTVLGRYTTGVTVIVRETKNPAGVCPRRHAAEH